MITPAFAQGAAGVGDAGSLMTFVPFILIFVVMYFLMIRPQQRKAKEHRAMLQAIRRGDIVVTAGGLVAKVARVADDQSDIEVEIAEGVKVKIVRSMIADVRTRSEPVKARDTSMPKAKETPAKSQEPPTDSEEKE